MRERIAIVVALLTVCFAIFISALFASKHNDAVAKPAPVSGLSSNSNVNAQNDRMAQSGLIPPGATIYEAKHCGTCHSIKGVGNPRSPLDGVGSRLGRTELREAIVGTGPASSKMSSAIRRRKARYTEMPADEMSKLLDYLSTLVVVAK